MSYQPNVVNKGDYDEINGATFIAKKDFNLANGDRKLVLLPLEHKKNYFKAQTGRDKIMFDSERAIIEKIQKGFGIPPISK